MTDRHATFSENTKEMPMRVTRVTLPRNGGKPPLRALGCARATKENPWKAGPFRWGFAPSEIPPSTGDEPREHVTPPTRLPALGVTTSTIRGDLAERAA